MAVASHPFDLHATHGFVRLAAAVPRVALGDPVANAAATLELAGAAAERGASVVVFPELGLCGYSLQDLLHQDALLDAVRRALAELAAESRELVPLLLVGAPLVIDGRLFNCAVAIHRGRVLGVVPKSYLPNYREFYERRHFAPASALVRHRVRLDGGEVPCGNHLLFASRDLPGLVVHAEICEDLWAPMPPSTVAAVGGATVLANLSASNVTIAKADYRRLLCASQSGRAVAAYVYTAAGQGESTTDLAWDGQAMIWENAQLLAEGERFAAEPQLVIADVDLERLIQERMRLTPFADAGRELADRVAGLERIEFELSPPAVTGPLARPLERFPYVPADPQRRAERCYEAYQIQRSGLAQRLDASGIDKVVLGVSGGLDSTQALLVAVKAMDRLGLPRENVLAYTMPGFATSGRTYENAWRLMRALSVTAEEIDIRPAARQMLEDIGHPAAEAEADTADPELYDRTYENVQAGERTSHLFRLANLHNALVVGTGDLSELALGWTTYGVGDQMSHYGVNASVPKTLIRHLIRWEAERETDAATREVLLDILATEISPELVPGADGPEAAAAGGSDGPAQLTEQVIGPYELQDFHLYYVTRFGFRPSKVAFLAHQAWGDAEHGEWPDGTPEEERRAYDRGEIKRWLALFLRRFFGFSQFKRSALPDGPKVGSGGSLSPRSDWRAPSDGNATAWLAELEENVP